jgi:hypothetical protein
MTFEEVIARNRAEAANQKLLREQSDLHKQCFNACEGCRHGWPLDHAAKLHTHKDGATREVKTTPCACPDLRDRVRASGGEPINEVPLEKQ